jgi:membrane-bound ClpP family serine protease
MKALDLHLSLALNNHGAKLSQAFGCDVLAYVGDIDDGSIPLYKEVIERLDDERKLAPSGFNADRLVIVLHTNGGIVEVVEKLVSITRSKYDVVDFLVPEHAMSAGTIWCMSGDSIFMDYASSLGPIDPQVRSSNGSLLQKADCARDFFRAGKETEGAGGHFWHDAVLNANIITPAPWMLSDANRSCNAGMWFNTNCCPN